MGQSPSGDSTTDDANYTPLIDGAAYMSDDCPSTTRYTKKPNKLSEKNRQGKVGAAPLDGDRRNNRDASKHVGGDKSCRLPFKRYSVCRLFLPPLLIQT